MQAINLGRPLQAELLIHVVKDKIVNSKRTNVKVVEFTTTSLEFISSLRFPVSEDVIYKLTIKMFSRNIEVYGMILTSIKRDHSNDYYYEMNFKVS
ncbi:hypothetical protein [Alkalihalobacillus sp. BA299]|uniref:hypothetical protein n=1 Tax=Alkalihalobacillus sp. BA299 TaxID=2815938 RepID=UPI001ADA4D4C|nr:hypothetical protein [Alkalihalobacillus sp. BA299]